MKNQFQFIIAFLFLSINVCQAQQNPEQKAIMALLMKQEADWNAIGNLIHWRL
jgi:hypothetical protein